MPKHAEQLSEMSAEDRDRIRKVLNTIVSPPGTIWGAATFADVWIAEHRMTAELRASARLTAATWVLVAAALVLASVTAHQGGLSRLLATLGDGPRPAARLAVHRRQL